MDLPSFPVSDVASAVAFAHWCVDQIGVGFHPDTPFLDYIDETGCPLFTPGESPFSRRAHRTGLSSFAQHVLRFGRGAAATTSWLCVIPARRRRRQHSRHAIPRGCPAATDMITPQICQGTSAASAG